MSLLPGSFGPARGPQPSYGGPYLGTSMVGSQPGPAQPLPPKRLDPDAIPSPVSSPPFGGRLCCLQPSPSPGGPCLCCCDYLPILFIFLWGMELRNTLDSFNWNLKPQKSLGGSGGWVGGTFAAWWGKTGGRGQATMPQVPGGCSVLLLLCLSVEGWLDVALVLSDHLGQ